MSNLVVDSPIFLHFLNRELRETENIHFTDKQVFEYLIIALLMTNEYIYVGDAIVWECHDVFQKSIMLLRDMEEHGLAYFVGTDIEVNSFLSKRRRLYSHDKKRYPVYFLDNMAEPLWGKHHKKIDSDTTAILARKLFDIVNGFDEQWANVFSNRDKDIIAKKLEFRRRNNIAVTYSLFKFERIRDQSKMDLRRNIIANYNQRYMDALHGNIMTGIYGLEYYDSFQNSGLYYDYKLHLYMLEMLGIVNRDRLFDEAFKHKIFELRITEHKIYQKILVETKRIANGLHNIAVNNYNYISFLKKNVKYLHADSQHIKEKLYALCQFSQVLCKNSKYFKEGYEEMLNISRRILILAASPLEYKVLRKTVEEYNINFEDKNLDRNEDFSYAECYNTMQSKIFLARTDMGALNASTVIGQLAEELQTTYIIMGGICAGMRPDEQHIGEIIISSQIHDYDLSKKTENMRISRGNTMSPNRYLYDKFLLESYEAEAASVDRGLFISSNTLANSHDYVNKVLLEYPDAKAYEMEGAGLMYICQLFKDKWILVKAICDWGYDKTDSNQELAARNSYHFILKTILERMG